MRTLRISIGVFTILPAPVSDLNKALTRKLVAFLPMVGVVIGVLAALVACLTGLLSGSVPIAALLGLVTLALTTGALHLDGIADTADGIGSRKPADQALEIMRKSDVGPMGVAALSLTLLVQWASLSKLTLPVVAAALIAGSLTARAVCVWALGDWFQNARQSGFGALFSGTASRTVAVLLALASLFGSMVAGFAAGYCQPLPRSWFTGLFEVLPPGLGSGIAAGAAFAVATGIAFLAGRSLIGWLSRRLGGLTGDTFGAIIEVSATAFWLTLALTL